MNKLFLLLFLILAAEVSAQPGDSINKKGEKQKLISGDSNWANPGRFNDSLLKTIPASDSIAINENFDRNVSHILELQKDHRAREKRNARIRIGIGIAFLIILIIGLRRKTIKKQGSR